MGMIELAIDGRACTVPEGTSILQAAEAVQVDIPHLCYDPRAESLTSCRLCVVRLAGRKGLVTACNTPVAAGMQVTTDDAEIAAVRKGVLELVLSAHRVSCTTCDQDGDCRLQDYAYRYGADEARFGRPPVAAPRPNYTSTNRGIAYDPAKCICCGLCVQYCSRVQMAEALTFARRGETMEVTTAFDVPLHESSCELCGGCIRVCPTGAMREKAAQGLGRAKDLDRVRTTCTYCGVGCELVLNTNPRLNRVVRVTALPGMGVNDGDLCVKGHFAFDFIHSPERLTKPLIRENGAFREATWEEAIETVGRRLAAARDQHGPEGIAFQSSSRCTNEENHRMQKIARMAGGTNNIDQCATPCHAPTVAGLAAAFGSGAMTNSIGEIRDVQTLFLIGANPTEAHPVIGLELRKALAKGARLIVCDPRETWMARHAHIHIQHRHGTDNLLINAMMCHILERGLQDQRFIDERCENADAFMANVRATHIEEAAAACGVPAGADAVVVVEETERRGDTVRVAAAVPGQHILRQGEDATAGTVVIRRGTVLSPLQIGLCAAVGRDGVRVHRHPSVRLLCSGTELREAGESVHSHQVRNTNGPAIAAALDQWGFGRPVHVRVPDRLEALAAELSQALSSADVVLLTGGMSAGRYDLARQAVEAVGMSVVFHGVAMKPGKPLLYATRDQSHHLFGLPGPPLSAMVGFFEFALPALRRLSGLDPADCQPRLYLPLNGPLTSKGGRLRLVPATVQAEHRGLLVTPVPARSSSDVVISSGPAAGVIVVPPDAPVMAAGDLVEFHPWRTFP